MKSEPRDEPRLRAFAAAARRSWPEGATAGILLVAAACVGLSVTLYQLAGPRDVFAVEASR
ncbi:MAG: hypothetical protein ACJ8EH_07665 [Sphingomicrobium sp.]